ncbi:MAG TPA: HPr family phosphocarrier protein [Lachnospiraceae bacterium]
MKKYKIKLDCIKNVEEFVRRSNRCPFDVEILYNKFIIDGKSILGLLSMDLSKCVEVECGGEDSELDLLLAKLSVQ